MDHNDFDRDLELYRADPAALRRQVERAARARRGAQLRGALSWAQRNLSFIASIAVARASETLFHRIIGSSR